MLKINARLAAISSVGLSAVLLLAGCQGPTTGNTNLTTVNTNANITNTVANLDTTNTNSVSGTTIESREPDQYQATVTLSLEAIGDAKQTSLPTIGANVGRSGTDRVMEFKLPTGENVIYLDKAGTNYLILPGRKQYAELNRESVGFEIRRMLMPGEIVDQVKGLQGVRFVGEENINGRQVMKYAYTATANTQTQAGQVNTESFLIVDKETGLPLRSETVSQSQSGGNVQGFKGMRIVTEMTNIKPVPDQNLFVLPTDYAKIDAEQVKAQVNLVFGAVAALVGQALQQAQRPAQPAASPTMSPGM